MNIIQKPTPNKAAGRAQGFSPEVIVIHIMDGTLVGTDAHFASAASGVSAHYGIGKTGEIHQYVQEQDTAWHAGVVSAPSFDLYKVGINPNAYTIGIEHEGKPLVSDVWSNAMMQASAELVAEISKRWNIPLDRHHVIGHYQIRSSKPNCPVLPQNRGRIDQLIELAKTFASSPSLPPQVEEGLALIEQGVKKIKGIN